RSRYKLQRLHKTIITISSLIIYGHLTIVMAHATANNNAATNNNNNTSANDTAAENFSNDILKSPLSNTNDLINNKIDRAKNTIKDKINILSPDPNAVQAKDILENAENEPVNTPNQPALIQLQPTQPTIATQNQPSTVQISPDAALNFIDEQSSIDDIANSQTLNLFDSRFSPQTFSVEISNKNDLPDSDDIQSLLRKSANAIKMGYFESSIHLAKQALSEEENNYNALSLKALGNYKLKQYEQAKMIYEDILVLYPKSYKTFDNLMKVLNHYSADYAIEEIEKLEIIDPYYSKIYGQKGLLYLQDNNYLDALPEFKQAAKLDPNNSNYILNLALIYDKIGNIKNALFIYEILLKKSTAGEKIPIDTNKLRQRYNYLSAKIAS
ncbi:MAG: tetratricopeptide repeat protein, partial [Pseudomonadota bacterium]